MSRKRFFLASLILALLITSTQPMRADAPTTTVYLPLVSGATPATDAAVTTALDAPALMATLPTTATASSDYHVYLPLVNQGTTAQNTDQVDAALFGWLWPSPKTSSEYSLNIEKRNFDAGGGGIQVNLLLIPRIIDLLDILDLTGINAKKVWGLRNTELDRAQSLSKGTGVTVAVLDTGASLLTSELLLRTVAGYDFVDDDRYPYESINLRDDDRDGQIDEGAGHGTFVSSIIAAATRNTRIMPVRVLNSDGNGTPEIVAKGIRYAADRGVQIINLSLSSDLDDARVREAIAYAAGKGIVIVAAALSSSNQIGYPAGYPQTLAVGAIDLNNQIPTFALGNAAQIDLFAPGVDIYGPAMFGNDVWMSGNSMATAFVSAEAALLMEGGRCNAACVRTLLTSRVNPVVPDQGGRGRMDAYLALLNRP